MKFERISENQIRCTLSRSDLADREIKLSELAYGSAKARELFQEMMSEAYEELGFHADNTPLMIEAVPLSSECIMLIITKVSDPEELDTRFSSFTNYADSDAGQEEEDDSVSDAHQVLDLFKRIQEEISRRSAAEEGADEDTAAGEESSDEAEESIEEIFSSVKKDEKPAASERMQQHIYTFDSLDVVTAFACQLGGELSCVNTLYKDTEKGIYYLLLSETPLTREGFETATIMASEFGSFLRSSRLTASFLKEHCEVIIKDQALQVLRSL